MMISQTSDGRLSTTRMRGWVKVLKAFVVFALFGSCGKKADEDADRDRQGMFGSRATGVLASLGALSAYQLTQRCAENGSDSA